MNKKYWITEITKDDIKVLNAAKNSAECSWLASTIAHLFGESRHIVTALNDVDIVTYKGVDYFVKDWRNE